MNRSKKMISWSMLLIWMGIIFLMSHQPGEISSNQSELVLKVFAFFGINLNSYFGELATLVIRKTAHFTEYLILFLLVYRVLCLYILNSKARIYAIAFVFLYACTDELHQYFIPGRAMAFKDVLIDTTGGIIGFIFISIINRGKEKQAISK
ncbi:VanZ family protein [Clostridium carnis]